MMTDMNFHLFYDLGTKLDLHRFASGFYEALICNRCGMQANKIHLWCHSIVLALHYFKEWRAIEARHYLK